MTKKGEVGLSGQGWNNLKEGAVSCCRAVECQSQEIDWDRGCGNQTCLVLVGLVQRFLMKKVESEDTVLDGMQLLQVMMGPSRSCTIEDGRRNGEAAFS